MTDVLGEEFDGRPDLWSPRARAVTGSAALAAIGAAGTGLVPAGPHQRLLAVAGVLLAAVLAGRLGGPRAAEGRTVAVALTCLALGIAATTGLDLALAPGVTATGWVLPVATALGMLGWSCTGAGIGLGLGSRPALAGSLLGLGAAAVPLAVSGLRPERAAAVGAAVAVVACGLLPRYATWGAGLTALDSAVLGGGRRRRDDVRRTVDRAYAALTWSTVAVAGTLAATAGVLLASPDPWAAGLGVAVVAVTALRTRAFPVAAQQMALWAAVLAALVVGAYGRAGLEPRTVTAALAGLAAAIVALLPARPPAHTRAALRQLGDVAEAVAVIALVPLAVGMFGIYRDLIGAF